MNDEARQSTSPRESRSRRRLLPLALGLVILVSGIAIGAGSVVLTGQKPPKPFGHYHEPEERAERVARRMSERLELTADQSREIEVILKRRFTAMDEIVKTFHPRMAEQYRLMREEIDPLLTEEQRERWHEKLKKFENRVHLPPDRWGGRQDGSRHSGHHEGISPHEGERPHGERHAEGAC